MDVFKVYQILGILYPAIVLILSVAVIIWSVKTGQFKSQSRASRLPLEINETNEEETF